MSELSIKLAALLADAQKDIDHIAGLAKIAEAEMQHALNSGTNEEIEQARLKSLELYSALLDSRIHWHKKIDALRPRSV